VLLDKLRSRNCRNDSNKELDNRNCCKPRTVGKYW
jgi:hypothetical protein